MKIPEEIQNYDSSKALVDEGQIRGGKVTVTDTTARDNIPLDKRKIGMFVTVGTSTKYYGGTDVTNTNWTNANNWFSILDKEYGDTLYKRRGTELVLKGVVISETELEIDVYSRTGIYMNGKHAFSCVAYATEGTPEKQVAIDVIPIDSSKFKVVKIEGGYFGKVNLFITYQEIIWDYEGVMTIGYLNPYSGYNTASGIQTYGSMSPIFPYSQIGIYNGLKKFNWNNTSPFDMNISGNIFAVEVNGIIYAGTQSYNSSINLTTFTPGPDPFTLVNGQCIVKVKVQ